jgi:hypothetical protein
MAYEFHIHRKDDWADDAGREIGTDEWIAYCEADPQLRIDEQASGGQGLMAVWTGPEAEGWFWLRNGVVRTKYIDPDQVAAMFRMADHFGARVQGDDGEFVTEGGDDFSPGPRSGSAGAGRPSLLGRIRTLFGKQGQ